MTWLGAEMVKKKCAREARWLTTLRENGIMTLGFAAEGRVMF
jgi:hypothetical protein